MLKDGVRLELGGVRVVVALKYITYIRKRLTCRQGLYQFVLGTVPIYLDEVVDWIHLSGGNVSSHRLVIA